MSQIGWLKYVTRMVAATWLLGLTGTAVGQSGVTVSGVTAAQRNDNSKLVDIYYNLSASGPCTVWPVVSGDGGATWNVPAQTYTGDFGANIPPGSGRHIVWDAGADIPGKVGSFRTRVFADDGSALTNMVLVPGGTFPYQNNTSAQIFVPTFLIDKYEVTNQRYAEFLNDADPNGQYWTAQQEITRNVAGQSVFYAPWPGKQEYPVRYVSALDAEAFAAWLSTREGRNFRLPTDQEWEKAAGWDPLTNTLWFYGFINNNNSIDCTWANYSQCVGVTREVGYYNGQNGTGHARSPYGGYDMSGNVFEWTGTLFSGGPAHTFRGGHYLLQESYCRTTTIANQAFWPGDRTLYVGFRLVQDAQ